jgi:hypothetical protein
VTENLNIVVKFSCLSSVAINEKSGDTCNLMP